MKPVLRVNGTEASSLKGQVKLDIRKSLWNGTIISTAIFLGPTYFNWPAFFIFVILTYLTLLVGHSIGMHRMMIHRTFMCPKPLERLLIYIGVLVGIGGPTRIITIHDTRDWAQRQTDCHDFFSHKRSFLRDVSWQLFYKFDFQKPPKITIEESLASDPWIIFFDKTWPIHQLLLASILFWIGGIAWVIWGVCVRVAVSTIGHWSITYVCHNPGPGKWIVKEAGVQASNINFAGFLTHGECWHNNHHAFPESARIGLDAGQTDPAWLVIKFMQTLGWVTNVKLPRPESLRSDLMARSET